MYIFISIHLYIYIYIRTWAVSAAVSDVCAVVCTVVLDATSTCSRTRPRQTLRFRDETTWRGVSLGRYHLKRCDLDVINIHLRSRVQGLWMRSM